ncbi:MAG: class I SAM-dependent methyltransferase [Sphingomonadales bacterium]|nr:class I SAM-dependent methyltransferase [Sphingomonadales bacterium]
MYVTSTPAALPRRGARQPARSLLQRLTARIRHGSLTLTLPDGTTIHHDGAEAGPQGHVSLRNWRALRRIAWRGDLGFAEGYIAGDWTSPDLTRLIALAAANVAALDALLDGSLPLRLVRRLTHALRGNSRRGSRRNIAFHYDLGNDFYQEWLDDSMTYSAALGLASGQSLESAQAEKLDRIAALLGAGRGDHVLEIGCGWGALAARLAREAGQVTAITLSREQLAYARQRRLAPGASVDWRLQDYRAVDAQFDRVVSIEMLEAVGEAWWPTWFGKVHDCLKPGGRAVVQVITIAEDRYDHYRGTPDFIQRYIFPGGMLPTRTILQREASAAGLVLTHEERFAGGYAATLAEWRRRFRAGWDRIAPLGFDDRFRRLWEYYLCYCEAGFQTGQIDVGLYVLERPG